jgi:hypothetical protein
MGEMCVNILHIVILGIIKATSLVSMVFWIVTPYSQEKARRFGETMKSKARKKSAVSIKLSPKRRAVSEPRAVITWEITDFISEEG